MNTYLRNLMNNCYRISLIIFLVTLINCSSDEDLLREQQSWDLLTDKTNDVFALRSVIIDDNGVKWLGTFYNGLISFNDGKWTYYNTNNSSLPNDTIQDIYLDHQGLLWIATNNGIAKFNKKDTWVIFDRSNSPLPLARVNAIAVEKDGDFWVGAGNTELGGLYFYDINTKKWQIFNSQNSEFPNRAAVTDIEITENGTVWISTYLGGIIELYNSKWKFFNTSNSLIPYNIVDRLYLDKSENIWLIMTAYYLTSSEKSHGSLAKFDGDTFREYFPYESGWATNRVTAMSLDMNENLWVATSVDSCCPREYALSKFDGRKWISYSPQNSTFPKTFILEIAVDVNNILWLASDKGLIKFQP